MPENQLWFQQLGRENLEEAMGWNQVAALEKSLKDSEASWQRFAKWVEK